MPEFSVAELSRSLVKATDEAKRNIRQLAYEAAQRTQSAVQNEYPVLTGNLRDNVFLKEQQKDGAPLWRVRSAAPHVHIWQKGTKVRQNAKGANRGRMPVGGPVLQRAAAKARAIYLSLAQQFLDQPREL